LTSYQPTNVGLSQTRRV